MLNPRLNLTTSTKKSEGSLKDKLFYLRHQLTRKRLYHKALNSMERGIVHLVLKLDVKLVSSAIIDAVKSIIMKAQVWLQSLNERALAIGRRIAEVNVNIAKSWGLDAKDWLEDKNYILLLGLNAIASSWKG